MLEQTQEPHATASTIEEALEVLSRARAELGDIEIRVVPAWVPRGVLQPLVIGATAPNEEVERGLESMLAASPTSEIAFFPILQAE